MNRLFVAISCSIMLLLACCMNGCQQGCVNNILLQTTSMDIRVNNENLGVTSIDAKNSADTVRSAEKQFYNYPQFRQFGQIFHRQAPSLINSAYAASDCPDQQEYISRLDPAKTELSLNVPYDGSAIGLGWLPADTNLLAIESLKDPYLMGMLTNPFLNAGAPTPLTIQRDFFEPINNQWITFHFYFEELDGTAFIDSVTAYIDMLF